MKEKKNLLYLPTHGLTHNKRCHPIHLYNSRKSAANPSQAQLVRNSVPKIFNIDCLQRSDDPEHILCVESTEHAFSYAISFTLKQHF